MHIYKFHRSSLTGTPRRIYVDSTSILHRYVEAQISTNFNVISTYFFPHTDRKIHVVSTYVFPCNCAGRKIHVASTTFFRCNLMIEKSTLFPRTFFDVISMVEKSTLFPRTFFNWILKGKNSASLLVNCKLMKTLEEVFLGL